MTSNSFGTSHLRQTSAEAKDLPGNDEEEEEEEQLVLVELTGIIDSDILEKCDNKCKILGINTEKPFLQVDKYVFAGEYEDALGTCVIFEEIPDQGDGDSAKPKLKYKCHTVKKLNMTRTFLTEKRESDEGGGKIEWFQIKDDSSSNWPQMICSFAQEIEEADESQSEEEGQGQLDGSTMEIGAIDQSFDSEGKQHYDSERGHSESEGKRLSNSERGHSESEGKRRSDFEKGHSEENRHSDSERGHSESQGKRRSISEKGQSDSEGKQHFDPEKVDNDTDKLLSPMEQERHLAKEATSAQEDKIGHDQTP